MRATSSAGSSTAASSANSSRTSSVWKISDRLSIRYGMPSASNARSIWPSGVRVGTRRATSS